MVWIRKNLAPWTTKYCVCPCILQHPCFPSTANALWLLLLLSGALLQSFDFPGQHFSFRAAQHPQPLSNTLSPCTRLMTCHSAPGSWSELVQGPLLCLILLISLCWPVSKPSEPCNGPYRCEQQKEEHCPRFSAAAMLFSEAPRDTGESGNTVNPPIIWSP